MMTRASSRVARCALVAWIVALPAICGAAVSDRQAAERERIRSERAAAEARFTATETECRTRFVVTACVDEARQVRRETLSRLRREESVLEDEVRKQRTADRMRELDENREREETSQRGASSPQRGDAARDGSAPQVKIRPPKAVPAPASSASTVNRSAEEARNRAAFEARRADAEAHRRKIEERNAARAAKGKPAAPLPVPPAPPSGASAP